MAEHPAPPTGDPERLARRHERLRERLRSLVARLRDSEQRHRETRRENRALRAELAARDARMATLAHEVRSPLRSLLGLLDLDAHVGDARDADRRTARDLVAHVLHVAEDGLDLAQLERGDLHLRAAPFDLETELGRVLDVVVPEPRPRVPVLVDLEPGLPIGWIGDASRIRQILINLLANAVAHTDHGVVTLGLHRSPGAVDREGLRIEVVDSGAGIAPAAQQHMFAPFEQGRAGGRAGLGLAVVHRLVDLMDGVLTYETEIGVGTRFVVDLPLPPTRPGFPEIDLGGRRVTLLADHAAGRHALAGYLRHWGARLEDVVDAAELEAGPVPGRAPELFVIDVADVDARLGARIRALRADGHVVLAPAADGGRGAERALWPTALARALGEPEVPDDPAGAVRDAPAEGAHADAAPARRVLVVDDHPVARRVLGRLLDELGCAIMAAEDGASAVEIADDPEERFDWVLLDRHMPGMDGIATAAALRHRRATRDARLVLLVNDAVPDDPEVAVLDAVLVRPEGAAALGDALARELRAPPRAVTRDEDAADLSALRDRTLAEDVDGALAALDAADIERVDDHIHRMCGALRVCPEPGRTAALDAIRAARAGDDADALRAALLACAARLREANR